MFVQLRSASDLLHLDDVLEAYDELDHALYLATRTSTDFNYIVETLGEREARVMLRPYVNYLPQTRVRYNLINELSKAGCVVAVVPRGDSRREVMAVRGHLAELVRAGLKKEEAYKMLTLHPASLLGLADSMGSIEKERRADLVFFDGDPLDPHATVRRVMILGKTVYNADDKK